MSLDRAVTFIGPSLARAEITPILDAELRPPARYGDVYRSALQEPRAILLIDGCFEDGPAVFHKEILWALSRGIHVFGAASIGALRAAELDSFGMVGIGAIYSDYSEGRLEADDAVAVLHGPEELGWPLITRALVDIEATFAKAQRVGAIDNAERVLLSRIAGGLFWRKRTFWRISELAVQAGWSPDSAAGFADWLAQNEVSQKALDATALLEHVAASWTELEEPFRATFDFEETAAWQVLRARVDWASIGLSSAEFQRLVSDLRDDGLYDAIETEGIARVLAKDARSGAPNRGRVGDIEASVMRFRRDKGLATGSEVMRWIVEERLAHADYVALVDDHANLEDIRARHSLRIALAMVRVLQDRGLLWKYVARAHQHGQERKINR